MKKLIAAALALLMLLPLAACTNPSGGDEPTPAPTGQSAELPTEEPAVTEEATELPPEETEEPTELPPEETDEPAEETTEAPTSVPASTEVMIPRVITYAAVSYYASDVDSARVFLLYPDGQLYGWGVNSHSELGDGSMTAKLTPTHIMDGVKDVVPSRYGTYMLTENGDLYVCGDGRDGGLYMGDRKLYKYPEKIMSGVESFGESHVIKSDGSLWMQLGGSFTKVGENVREFKNGFYLTKDNKLYLLNTEGQDKLIASDVSSFRAVTVEYAWALYVLKTDGHLCRYTRAGENYDLKNIDSHVADYDVGGSVYYVKDNGGLYGFGRGACYWSWTGEEDEIAKFQEPDKVKDVMVSSVSMSSWKDPSYYGFALRQNGELWTWCEDHVERCGRGELDEDPARPRRMEKNVVWMTSNGVSAYVIKQDGSLWGCGSVEKGVIKGGIGNGTYENVYDFVRILKNVESFSQLTLHIDITQDETGGEETIYNYATTRFAVKSDGSVWAWGSGENGLLGNGGTKRADKPVKIMDPKYM